MRIVWVMSIAQIGNLDSQELDNVVGYLNPSLYTHIFVRTEEVVVFMPLCYFLRKLSWLKHSVLIYREKVVREILYISVIIEQTVFSDIQQQILSSMFYHLSRLTPFTNICFQNFCTNMHYANLLFNSVVEKALFSLPLHFSWTYNGVILSHVCFFPS